MLVAQACLLLSLVAADPLLPGNHRRDLQFGGIKRSYLTHLPPQYDGTQSLPVVLCFHGAVTNGGFQAIFTGMSKKADAAGFIVVYPDGTGPNNVTLFWNSGGVPSRKPENERDDVGFVRALLDDLATVVKVDAKRVYACGMSNGGMMTHRLGVELSDRIAAIAPVGGTLGVKDPQAKRAMPVLHIHGTEDTFVPWEGRKSRIQIAVAFRSVDDTLGFWVNHNGCTRPPQIEKLPDADPDDGTTVERHTYAPGPKGAEVVLIKIVGGGHTWPGQEFRLGLIGNVSEDVAANDLIWDFFQKHRLP